MSPRRGLYVVMGVSGCGKTTVGSALAGALGVPFVEGDDYHPHENVRKMASGVPLTDADRAPWLQALARRIAQASTADEGVVVACSALKRAYRDLLRQPAPALRFIHLHGPPSLIAQRLAARSGHYMPATLLDSQLATLEPPDGAEPSWTFDLALAPEDIVTDILRRIQSE
jgi:gluconokinase